MPRKYEHAVVLSDGSRIGYGLFRRGETWYVRFVDGNGKRVKKSLGKISSPLFNVTKRGQKRNPHLRHFFHQRKIEEVAEEVVRLTFNLMIEDFD